MSCDYRTKGICAALAAKVIQQMELDDDPATTVRVCDSFLSLFEAARNSARVLGAPVHSTDEQWADYLVEEMMNSGVLGDLDKHLQSYFQRPDVRHGLAVIARAANLDGADRNALISILGVKTPSSPPTDRSSPHSSPRTIGVPDERVRAMTLSRAEVEAYAHAGHPVAQMALRIPPVAAPDWSGEGYRAFMAGREGQQQAFVMPTPAEVVERFGVPKPTLMVENDDLRAALGVIERNLNTFAAVQAEVERLTEQLEGTADPQQRAALEKARMRLYGMLSYVGRYLGYLIVGPPGTGKTTLMQQLAAFLPWRTADGAIRYGVPCAVFDVSGSTDPYELLAGMNFRGKGQGMESYTLVGLLPAAAHMGAVIVINEINEMPTDLQTTLHGLAEGNRGKRILPIPSVGGIPVAPGAIVGLTMNPMPGRQARPSLADRVTNIVMAKRSDPSDDYIFAAATVARQSFTDEQVRRLTKQLDRYRAVIDQLAQFRRAGHDAIGERGKTMLTHVIAQALVTAEADKVPVTATDAWEQFLSLAAFHRPIDDPGAEEAYMTMLNQLTGQQLA